ncbi:hypothetical protein [Massilia rubra]|uniref:Uncharacterized protein n=1 Tax=Massilia rubra TaxID=2607910 RepID=A0ABX0LBS5_9BURK|nr:hypothetical protein [Massilia rubra]NHZ32323.1 hypothetical protein [Massilia rubra]
MLVGRENPADNEPFRHPPETPMFPSHYACSSCHEKFEFAFREAWYYVGTEPVGNQVAYDDLLSVNIRPAWCKDCDCLCLVEDIASVRVFEDAYGAARGGRKVDYPGDTEYMDAAGALKEIEDQLRWRMGRRQAPRALCCGGARYQLMNVAQPLLKHAQCDFGVVEPKSCFVGAYCGPGPGERSPANLRVYDAEGDLIGQLTWNKREQRMWAVEPLQYPLPVADN